MRQQQYLRTLFALLHLLCAVATLLIPIPAVLLPVGDDGNTKNTAAVTLTQILAAQTTGSIGLLEDDESVARVVETKKTSSGEWTVGRPITSNVTHFAASVMTIALAILWSPMFHELQHGMFKNYKLHDIRLILYALYLIECAICSTRRYIDNTLSPSAWIDYITSLKLAKPTIEWKIECYHNSGSKHRKRVTHRASRTFGIGHWREATVDRAMERQPVDTTAFTCENTTNIDQPTTTTFLKATVEKLFVLHNPAVRKRYLQEESLFELTEGQRDKCYKFTRHIRFPQTRFRHKVLIVETGMSDVVRASGLWFWLASIMGLTVPYRVWFDSHCRRVRVTVTKEIE